MLYIEGECPAQRRHRRQQLRADVQTRDARDSWHLRPQGKNIHSSVMDDLVCNGCSCV